MTIQAHITRNFSFSGNSARCRPSFLLLSEDSTYEAARMFPLAKPLLHDAGIRVLRRKKGKFT